MATAHTYLNFPGNTEEAFEFYRSVFGGEFTSVVRFGDFGPANNGQLAEADRDKIMHIGLKIGENDMLMGTDAPESMGFKVTFGNNSYIYVEADSAGDAERLFGALSKGGKVEMELAKTEWAEKYGSFTDKFGVQWMISYTGDVQFGGY
ncbi:MAG TPA: VOC family protein [Trueperaceae bacterium]